MLLIARDPAARIGGSVQLDLAMRVNARHRAARRIGRALMVAVEDHACRLGRTTIVPDTRQGDPSEALYRALGWTEAGTIPRYAESADGTLYPTAIYYRLLDRQAT